MFGTPLLSQRGVRGVFANGISGRQHSQLLRTLTRQQRRSCICRIIQSQHTRMPAGSCTSRSVAGSRHRQRLCKAQSWQEGGPEESYTGDNAELPRVGVLGGGQLGKMLATAAAQMGVPISVLDPTPNCPAAVAAQQTEGSFRDGNAIRDFANGVDVLTVEIEHVETAVLADIEADQQHHCSVHPSAKTLEVIQDKFRQKQFFSDSSIPTADFRSIGNASELAAAGEEFGFPFMLKSRMLAYDGRGNAVVREDKDAAAAVEALGGFQQGLYAERWCPFEKELAVMVARGVDGETRTFPVVQTIHRDNICWVTETPAQVPASAAAAATELAEATVKALAGAGMFGVEMFLLPDGQVLLNEVAPRPHNSGHYTIEGCYTSQYEQHLRAVLGWPLGSTDLKVGSAIMLNLLGEDGGAAATQAKLQRAFQTPGAAVHWYGKAGITQGRKLGHVTITAGATSDARAALRAIDPAAAEALEAEGGAAAAGEAAPRPQVGIIMGSDSDLRTMSAAAAVLEEFGVPCEVTIVSAHRTPDRMEQYARSAPSRGLKVIIAGAGGAAHLPGMVASQTPLPVIGVPVVPSGAYLGGVDAKLSILQMPKGVPVATVAIGNAANAGLLAIRILAAHNPSLRRKMEAYQADMKTTVEEKAARLESLGWRDYLGSM